MPISNVHELNLGELVYVSRSTLSLDGDADAVAEIVNVAQARNASLRVTGALVYTELHFTQVLEGPAPAISELMDSITRDPRHRDVTVVLERKIHARRFGSWLMAYAGPSPYLDRHIKPLISPRLSDDPHARLVEALIATVERLQGESG